MSASRAKRFSKKTVAAIRDGKILGIRAGMKPHRIIGIWAVVVENRVFVRLYSMKPRSWYRTFLEEPRGIIEVEGREIPVRAVFTRSERLKDSVDRAYAVTLGQLTLAANAAEHDPVEMYKVELLAGARQADDRTMAESYVRTALAVC